MYAIIFQISTQILMANSVKGLRYVEKHPHLEIIVVCGF